MLYKCKNCRYTKEVSDKFAGKSAKCPKCGAVNSIGEDADGDILNVCSPGFAKSIYSEARKDPVFIVKKIDKLMEKLRLFFDKDKFQKCSTSFAKYGQYCLLISCLLGLLIAVLLSIKFSQFYFLLIGLAWCFLLIVLQYSVVKFIIANERMADSTPSQVSSCAYFDCLALFFGLAGAIVLGVGLYSVMKFNEMDILFVTVAIFIGLEFLAWIAINPSIVNIDVVEKTSAGLEFVGISSFFLKCMLKMSPIVFGANMVVGLFYLALSSVHLLQTDKMLLYFMVKAPIFSGVIVGSACLPFFVYFAFITNYFLLDMCRSILLVDRR